ncbi:protein-serine/threonine phosphatase [Yamadazyma tenuis]|uniref:RNA polymerase II subunit B1 CTD phosphatase RPAP2 homolog n=1 Tax=Candida tenuis (strain ATCC 10573 / BCRC 21748 / CBS 615 / JCM 9827 / NBRC 10315 / NRRL Y-1498 / VKM Y-70) TaxID=590646 RepID=G3BBL8_CANTC|nr:uncharacterized protein CANTEDRAFT_115035 [Yamadazyma tenuis ATCC 10573]XP_006687739.1 uncharacterized protein CANTEDRAFT_115035 [Yamadazyma tenuis ATCC 10573]EGV61568.1 hypothetical protein CANTEDRAFT_115035 [Yamadazyma tenuis ATCC 10573]EGV61569.1 hypothetical protein CANTEDRAFT_115035 [Yamadazyma tenuis ATCC 10573]WEJ92791.1 protein-serine/threonine phosphatase [Yamadazyma tenuis]
MALLTLPQFIPRLEPFGGRELLTPADTSKLSLVITELLIDHPVDIDLLKFLSRFLTQQSYDEIVEERNIEHQCGYITCQNTPRHQVRRLSSNSNGTTTCNNGETKFQIYNRKPSIILPNTYLSQYCCKEHYQASLFYRNQLSSEAVFARKNIVVAPPFPLHYPGSWYENGITCLEEVLAKHHELKNQGKSLSEVVRMMNGLTMEDDEPGHDTSELIKLIEDFEIVERDTPLPEGAEDDSAVLDDDEDEEFPYNPRKIDGYITTNKHYNGYTV